MSRDVHGWHRQSGDRVSGYSPDGASLRQEVERILDDAEQIVETLIDLLQPNAEDRSIHLALFLTGSESDRSQVPDAIALETLNVITLQPGDSQAAVAREITRVVLSRWFGPNTAAMPLFVGGLAVIVAGRIGSGPDQAATDAAIREEIAAGRPVSLFDTVPTPLPHGANPSETIDSEAASFVSFLLHTFGTDAFCRFLAAFDPERSDQAALDVFHLSLGALEEDWLASLQQRLSRGTAFRALLRQVIPLLRPYWKREIEVFAYMVFALTYGVVLALASRHLIDEVIPNGEVSSLVWYAGLLLCLFVIDAVVGLRRSYVNEWINTRVIFELRARMFEHLQYLPHGFYSRAKLGDLLTRLSGDLALVDQALAQVAGVGVFMALRGIIAAITLVALSPLLGTLVLAVVPIFAIVYFSLRTGLQRAGLTLRRLEADAAGIAQENLSAHAVIKAFGLQRSAGLRYRSHLDRIIAVTMRLVLIGGLYETSVSLATTLGQLVVLGAGGYLVIDGQISLGTLVAFLGLLPSLFSPIAALSTVGQTVEQASGALDRVSEVLDEPITIIDKMDAPDATPLERAIRLEDVEFAYEPGRPILKNLSLVIPAGAHVAIVGPSGCGKSSVINLLLRFFDPQSGRVTFDGRDIRDVTLASLRGQIGIVFQETFVFDTTVRENIAVGRAGATNAEIVAAARAADLHDYIDSLPAGYDTVLGERGVRMSGGQRQRLAIARALVRNPRILILDEATSALDAQTEAEVLSTIERLARERTTISITHRLTTAAKADRVIVLDQGQVVEQGTHDELLAHDGLYRMLYEEQTARIPSRPNEGPTHDFLATSNVNTAHHLRKVPKLTLQWTSQEGRTEIEKRGIASQVQ